MYLKEAIFLPRAPKTHSDSCIEHSNEKRGDTQSEMGEY